MLKLPISFVFMTSTKGHFGHRDIWRATLDHWARYLPLDAYATKVAHIKISESDQELGAVMARELEARGFDVLTTTANWSRGQVHQSQYLLDQIKVSKEKSIYFNPFVLYVEDDSPVVLSRGNLDDMLSTMCATLSDPDVLSARFMRENDWPPAGEYEVFHPNWLRHEHVNFQPLIMRSHQFYTMLKTAEDNLSAVSNVQIEMLWRLLLAPQSRARLPHLVVRPEVAKTVHLGSPDYPALKSSLGL